MVYMKAVYALSGISILKRTGRCGNLFVSIHAVSRVSVTSTVLCVVIWLVDIIILALSYSEFCKETQNIKISVQPLNQKFPRPYSVDPISVSRKCFVKGLNYFTTDVLN